MRVLLASALALVLIVPARAEACITTRTDEKFTWTKLPKGHPVRPTIEAWIRAFVKRDRRQLISLSALPLTIFYPKNYENGRVVAWEINYRATTPSAEERVLEQLLRHVPDAPAFYPVSDSDSPPQLVTFPDGTVRVRLCPDINHLGDDIIHQWDLSLRPEGRAWLITAVSGSWVSLM